MTGSFRSCHLLFLPNIYAELPEAPCQTQIKRLQQIENMSTCELQLLYHMEDAHFSLMEKKHWTT